MKVRARGSPTEAASLPDGETIASEPRCRDSTVSPRRTSTRTGGALLAAAARGLGLSRRRLAILLAEDASRRTAV
jgi:hypothetical protein